MSAPIPFACTDYFRTLRYRPDRAIIRDEWILQAIGRPMRVARQADGRLRHWAAIEAAGGRVLRVVLLGDGRTVHNAFFDRGFTP